MTARLAGLSRIAVPLVAALALAACSGGGGDDPQPESKPSSETTGSETPEAPEAPEPAAVDLEAPAADQLAGGVRLGDQTDQSLSGVAASGEAVVAVGSDTSFNVTRPLFVSSSDGGATWQRGQLDEGSVEITVGSELATSVAAGPDGFVAVGSGVDQRPITWTSPDGLTWTRNPSDPEAFKTSDDAHTVVHEGGRFWLIGSSTEPVGGATGRVVLWTSSDGTSWKRSDLSQHGLGRLQGLPYADDLVVTDGQVVLAGGVEDSRVTDQPNRMLVWRSDDGGRSFTADETPLDFGGGFRAYPRDLVVERGRLYLAASGDGASYTPQSESWDAVVMVADGRQWSKVAPAAFGSGVDEHPSTLVPVKGAWVLAGYSSGEREDAVVTGGSDLRALQDISDKSLGGTQAQYVNGGVAVGDAVVLVGGSAKTGSSEPQVWRVDAKGVSPVRLPDDIGGGRPSTQVSGLVATDDGFVAVGDAADSPVAWTSEDFLTWTPEGLTGRSALVGYVDVADAEALGDGRVIAVGSLNRGVGDDAGVWVYDGDRWTQGESPAFLNRGGGGYGGVTPTAVAAGRDAVVVAANAYINGQYEAHPLVGTPDGARWQVAAGARAVPPTDDDRYFARTPYLDFRAPENGSIFMAAAAAARDRFVIGGSRGEAGRGEQAVVWTSATGSTWDAARRLPAVKGAYATGVHHIVAEGRTVVVTGYHRATVDVTDDGWVSWVSTDGGRTFELGQVVAPEEATVAQVLAVPQGFVALGSVGPSTDRDAAAWFSEDGRTWSPVELGLERGSGPGQQYLAAGVVDGDELRVVASDVPPSGGGHYVTSFPVPG